MKVSTVAFAALLASGSVQAVAGPKAVADAEASRFCHHPGQSCGKLKRAADAAAEALAFTEPESEVEAEAWRQFCQEQGQLCGKVDRAVYALTEAVAVAAAAAKAEPELDVDPKVKRDAGRSLTLGGNF